MEKVNLTIRLDKQMKEEMVSYCAENDVTMSQLIRSIFRRQLNAARDAKFQSVKEPSLEGKEKITRQIQALKEVMPSFLRGPGGKSKGKRR